MPFGFLMDLTRAMKRSNGTGWRLLPRRMTTGALLALLVLGALSIAPASAQTFPPEECTGIAGRTTDIEGEVVDSEVLVDEFSTNIHLITVRTEEGTERRVEIDGRPELIEIGTVYRIRTLTVEGEELALISSAFGENLSCLSETDPDDPEAEPVPVDLGISTIDEDGEPVPLEEPPLIPALPISPRSFFIGFGIFALVIFLTKFR